MTDFLLQIALLDERVLPELEQTFIRPNFRVDHEAFIDTIDDYRDIPGLEVKPPGGQALLRPGQAGGRRPISGRSAALGTALSNRRRTSSSTRTRFLLNQAYYSLARRQARLRLVPWTEQLVFKIVGYAEQSRNTTSCKISALTSGLPTSATPQKAACGTRVARTRSWG